MSVVTEISSSGLNALILPSPDIFTGCCTCTVGGVVVVVLSANQARCSMTRRKASTGIRYMVLVVFILFLCVTETACVEASAGKWIAASNSVDDVKQRLRERARPQALAGVLRT